MADFIRIAAAGRLVRQPFYRIHESDNRSIRFTLAVMNKKNRNEEDPNRRYEPTYLDCVVFGTKAERLMELSLDKGDDLVVIGELIQESWTDGDMKKYRQRCYVEKFHGRRNPNALDYDSIPF